MGGDILIWNSDTLRLSSCPLRLHFQETPTESQFFNEIRRQIEATTPNEDENDWWRYISEFQIEWLVQNDSIFLNKMHHTLFREIEFNMSNIFPDNKGSEKIFASWINRKLYISKGDCIPESDCFFCVKCDLSSYIYEYEIALNVKNGLLKSYEVFHNQILNRVDRSLYSQFISNSINWEILPSLSNKLPGVYASVLIQPNEQGQFESIVEESAYLFGYYFLILWYRNLDNPFIQETIRIAKMMPKWTVVLQRGKILPIWFDINFYCEYRRRFGK